MKAIHTTDQAQLYKTIHNQLLLITVANLSNDIVLDITNSATELANSGDNANNPQLLEAIRHITEVLSNTLLHDISQKSE